jgi:hypothetical protein
VYHRTLSLQVNMLLVYEFSHKKQSVIRTPIMASPGKKQEIDAPVRANPKKVVAYVMRHA